MFVKCRIVPKFIDDPPKSTPVRPLKTPAYPSLAPLKKGDFYPLFKGASYQGYYALKLKKIPTLVFS